MSRRGAKLGDDIFSTGAVFAPFAIKIISSFQNKKQKKQEMFNSLPKEKQKGILLVRYTRYQKIAMYVFLISCGLEVFATVMGRFSFGDIKVFLVIFAFYGGVTYKKKKLIEE